VSSDYRAGEGFLAPARAQKENCNDFIGAIALAGICPIIRRMSHIIVTIEGRKYQIPQMWMVGATRTLGTVQAAVQRWHEQAVMAGE
jgi:hypothetical protein